MTTATVPPPSGDPLPERFLTHANQLLSRRVLIEEPRGQSSNLGLPEASRAVAHALGVSVDTAAVANEESAGRHTYLNRLLRASGLRQRVITLEDDWFTHDFGPLLAFMREDGRAVALIPRSKRTYQLADPVKDQIIPVTPDVAGQLEPQGRMFYRPLPPGKVTGRILLRHALRGLYGEIGVVFFVSLLAAVLSLLVPLMTELIFNEIIPVGERSQLLQIGAGLILAALVTVLFRLTGAFALLRIEGKSNLAAQTAVWDRLLRLPAGFFQHYTAGDLANRVDSINAIRHALSTTVVNYLLGAVFSAVNLALIFYYSWKLALLALLLALVAAIVDVTVAWLQLGYHRRSLNLGGAITGRIFQLLTGISKWKAVAGEERALDQWSGLFLEKKAVDKSAGLIRTFSGAFSGAFPVVTTLVNFGFYFYFLQGTMNVGSFLGYNAAFTQLLAALLAATSSTVTLVNIIPLFGRVAPILGATIEQPGVRADPGLLTGRVEMRNLSFRYGPANPTVLQDLSFEVNPGDFVAIVGGSGAGKSTIVRLLLGFEEPSAGAVLYDGKELRNLDLTAVRSQLGIVLQNHHVLAGDIFHNIVGTHPRTLADAWEAAELAGIKSEIEMLPMGMQTYIAEGGSTFSGGQLQRILIARALVNRPPILIFDEATSALDNVSQSLVSENIAAMHITRIVIAQRLSTIRNADRILVLEEGRIVQTGTFDELMEDKDGAFHALAARQLL
jgi:NHLM bacteriocin system ABC transporter ATP-binding protein